MCPPLKCFIQCILNLDNKEQKGKSDKRFALNRKVLSDILYKIKLDDAAVAMGAKPGYAMSKIMKTADHEPEISIDKGWNEHDLS